MKKKKLKQIDESLDAILGQNQQLMKLHKEHTQKVEKNNKISRWLKIVLIILVLYSSYNLGHDITDVLKLIEILL